MTPNFVTLNEISSVMNSTPKKIQKRAELEKWPVAKMKALVGEEALYLFSFLPWEIKSNLSKSIVDKNGQGLISFKKNENLTNIPERAKDNGLAKYRLVQEFRRVLKSTPWGSKQKAVDAFLLSYNSRILLPNVFDILGFVAEKTLRNFDRQLNRNNNDYICLCDGRGGWKLHGTTKYRKRKISSEAKKIFLQCYIQPSKPSVKMAIRATRFICEKKGIDLDCDDSTIRRYLKDYEKENSHVICFGREGFKRYQDKYSSYITRDSSILKPGDCLVADGKVLNFFIKNPDTGKPVRMILIVFLDWASRCPIGWQIMPTENTIAIAAAFRRSVITLGRYPKTVYTDNGKAFKSKFFTKENTDLEEMAGLYSRVGTEVFFAAPYNGRAKVVERFNLTFQEQFERIQPSFCGDSLSNRPAWMDRNEKFHKSIHFKKYKGWIPDIREASGMTTQYINWYVRQPHKGLNNKSPLETIKPFLGKGVDEKQLSYDFLWRIKKYPRRCRITLWGVDYEADFLHGLDPNTSILVMYDTSNLEKIYCYNSNNIYLGEAFPVRAIHPLVKAFGTEASVANLKRTIKKQQSAVKKTKERLLDLGASVEYTKSIDTLPWSEKVDIPPKIEPEEKQSRHEINRKCKNINFEEIDIRKVCKNNVERPDYFFSKLERYDWCFKSLHENSKSLSKSDENFMLTFEKTKEYKEFSARYNDLRMLYELDKGGC